MLLISDKLLIEFMNADEKLKLADFFNEKRFKVQDTSLSYRKINHLYESKLLPEDKERGRGWRKFSFKELIFLSCIKEARKFGMVNNQLRELWKCFFAEPTKQKLGANRHIADIAISCCFAGIEIFLTINSDEQTIFFDPIHFLLCSSSQGSFIQINFFSIVNNLLIQGGRKPTPLKYSLASLKFPE